MHQHKTATADMFGSMHCVSAEIRAHELAVTLYLTVAIHSLLCHEFQEAEDRPEGQDIPREPQATPMELEEVG